MPSLIALKNFIKEKQIVNLQSLAVHFRVTADTLQPMLSMLITKGYICQRKGANCGSTCTRCDIKLMKIYSWQTTQSH
ncbi:MAG: hypothetical protein COB66_08470 [Coxiella sp. (in: Bacteria)]|nr:MAG: hypothetical protein COB66_08470 [Coxiella sp. (in: g-proteobacteria)]